nr:TetR/AcrR family transcriptional regulator [Nitrospirillum iridis]
MEAARDYLDHHDIDTLTLRRVAELAGVSAPTVYAHFPTMDDLVAAFFHWLKPRIGLAAALPPLADFATLPARLFPRYEAHGALLRNLMNKPSWDRQRQDDRDARHAPWREAVATAVPGLTPAQQRRGALAVAAFFTPTLWRWLRDTGGLTPAEAELTAQWAMRTLVEGLARDGDGLADPPSSSDPTGGQEP